MLKGFPFSYFYGQDYNRPEYLDLESYYYSHYYDIDGRGIGNGSTLGYGRFYGGDGEGTDKIGEGYGYYNKRQVCIMSFYDDEP